MKDLVHSVPQTATAPSQKPANHARAFRWSWKFITVVEIGVYVHGTFLLLLTFVAFADLAAGNGVPAMLRSTALVLAVFTSVVLHEFGHALAARRFGIRTLDITLLPIGGLARLERMPEDPKQQIIRARGPTVLP